MLWGGSPSCWEMVSSVCEGAFTRSADLLSLSLVYLLLPAARLPFSKKYLHTLERVRTESPRGRKRSGLNETLNNIPYSQISGA